MVGRTFPYRSRSISRGPITISNASLIESDVMPVLNKEVFRTWQFVRLPRELGGDRNDVSALEYTTQRAFTCGANGSTGWARPEKILQNRDSMQLEETCSVGIFFKQFYLYYLQGNIMPIASNLMAKNSIVVFGALTDSTFIVSHYKKKTCLSPLSIQFFFSSFGSSERI
jgi:hypothetical protein